MTKSTSTRKDLEKILEHPAMYPLCPDCKKVYDQLEAYISSAVEQAREEGRKDKLKELKDRYKTFDF